VNHRTTPRFWSHYDALPSSVQRQADRCFERLKADPSHPSLHLKRVGRYWSARVGRQYRALAVEYETNLLWFWIGPHDEYDSMIDR